MARLVAILMDRKRDDKFRSSTPKLLHPLAGRALWQWSYEAVRAAGAQEICFVGDSAAMSELAEHSMVAANLDEAVKKLGAAQGYLLAYADAALLHPEDLLNIAAEGSDAGGPRLPDMRPPSGASGPVLEASSGEAWHPAFCYIPAAARKVLTGSLGPSLLPGGAKGDLSNVQVDSFESGFRILDRVDLADAEAHLRSRIVEAHMLEGVTFVDPASCFVDAGVSIGKDTVVHPFSFLTGDTQVGANCVVGPFARLHDSRLDDGAQVEQSVLESVRIRAGANVGPWARLRPGSDVGEQAHVGSFVELKNAKLGKSAKAGHLSYLGDTDIGEGANIGAGSITANFDGKAKHKTKIGKKAFIGSGSILVAPVEVGDSAVTGAGSVLLKGRNVPKGVTVAGVPAKPIKTVKVKPKKNDRMAEMSNEMKVFAGNSNAALAEEICQTLNQALGRADVGRFPEGECKVKINENVRGADVFIIQSTCPPVNENLMELLVMIDAARRASARRITAVIPYFGYARQDRKDQPRVPITAKLVANLIAEAGADRVLTMDLHAQQIQGFFDIPVDHLIAMPVLAEHFKKLEIPNLSICTADVGGIKGAWKFAERLNAPLAIVDKKRSSDTKVEALALIGDVKGKNIVIPDDMIATGGSLAQAAKFVREHGAKDLYAACTHGVLSGDAIASLKAAGFSEIVMTNTIPHDAAKLGANYRQLSIAKIFGEAILRIHKETSVSSLFE